MVAVMARWRWFDIEIVRAEEVAMGVVKGRKAGSRSRTIKIYHL
jgi:hypothetical protein